MVLLHTIPSVTLRRAPLLSQCFANLSPLLPDGRHIGLAELFRAVPSLDKSFRYIPNFALYLRCRLCQIWLVFIGGFMLSPGSRGLRQFETWLTGESITGVNDLKTTGATLLAIAMGMLVGTVIGRRWVWFREPKKA